MIPKRLIRTVPATTSAGVEAFWETACVLHPNWEHVTLRDPVNRANFPLTAHLWDSCESGAQLADLIRAEELWHRGGIYIDSDVELFRPLTAFLGLEGFAAWEDDKYIPNAVMGFAPQHPAVEHVVKLAVERHHEGTWNAGVGVTTEVFAGRSDMLLLPPGTFYEVHWRDKKQIRHHKPKPWAYGLHHYHASWQ